MGLKRASRDFSGIREGWQAPFALMATEEGCVRFVPQAISWPCLSFLTLPFLNEVFPMKTATFAATLSIALMTSAHAVIVASDNGSNYGGGADSRPKPLLNLSLSLFPD
jgi:hypothetical protein